MPRGDSKPTLKVHRNFAQPPSRYKKARHRLSRARRARLFIYAPLIRATVKVVGGSASIPLAKAIAKDLGASYIDVAYTKHPGGFPDGERYVRLLQPVAGDHAVVVQTTHPDTMVVELLLLADAIRDAGAQRLTAVVPYFGYGRQDKRFLDGEAVSAKTIAKHLAVDCDELLTMTIHNPGIPTCSRSRPAQFRAFRRCPVIS